jgi:hypothetical protein
VFDPYTLVEVLRMERQILAERRVRQAVGLGRVPRDRSSSTLGGLRRHFARALLVLADRLDPRGVVSVPRAPARLEPTRLVYRQCVMD